MLFWFDFVEIPRQIYFVSAGMPPRCHNTFIFVDLGIIFEFLKSESRTAPTTSRFYDNILQSFPFDI